MIRLESIFIYPFKSARGMALDSCAVEARGLVGDRRWMAVDANGRFLSQRTVPRLALLNARPGRAGLELSADGFGEIEVWADPSGERVDVTVWNDAVGAIDCGDDAAAWLSELLQIACRVVWQQDDSRRAVDAAYAGPGDHVSFADGFPLLVLTEASVRHLNERTTEPVPIERFRPNLVFSGAAAYEEDEWQEIRIGGLTIDVVKPCSRCAITTTDQRTGKRYKEPLRTLAGYRRRGNDVFFAQNAVPRGGGTLRRGDVLTVERRGPARFPASV